MLELVREYIDEHPGCQIMDVYEAFDWLSLDKTLELCEELEALRRIIFLHNS
jgi:hypothetical protein